MQIYEYIHTYVLEFDYVGNITVTHVYTLDMLGFFFIYLYKSQKIAANVPTSCHQQCEQQKLQQLQQIK